MLTAKGAAAVNDQLVLQYNSRSTSGGSDAWGAVFTVASQTGALAINTPTALNGAVTLNAGCNLNGQTVSGNATFSGALALNGNVTQTNGNCLFQNTTYNPGTLYSLAIQTSAPPNPAAGSSSAFWFQPGGGLLALNYWNGSAWIQSANFSSTTGGWTFVNPNNLNFGNNWQNYTLTVSAASGTVSVTTLNDSQFLRIGPICFWKLYVVLTISTSQPTLYFSLPVAAVGTQSGGAGAYFNASTAPWYPIAFQYGYPSPNTLQVIGTNGVNIPASQTLYFILSGSYRVA